MSLIADGTDAPDQQRPSLRERKKLATRRSIRRVALGLIAERGFAHVTVEDIAEAADISPRTFFNYFPSKEAALFGADNERTEALRQRLLDQPAEVAPLDALRATLVGEACAVAEELGELGGDTGAWLAVDEGGQRRPPPAGSTGRSHGGRRESPRRRSR